MKTFSTGPPDSRPEILKIPKILNGHFKYFFRKEKLRKQFLKNAEIEKNIFDGQKFWINGRTKPPAHELEVLLGRFGGVRDYVLTPRTDFHIVENLPRAKRIKLRDYDKVGNCARWCNSGGPAS